MALPPGTYDPDLVVHLHDDTYIRFETVRVARETFDQERSHNEILGWLGQGQPDESRCMSPEEAIAAAQEYEAWWNSGEFDYRPGRKCGVGRSEVW